MEIYKDNHPNLFIKCKEVEYSEYIVELSEDMFNTMRHAGGIGLAANQVGVLWRVFVMDTSKRGNRKKTFLNPEIVSTSGIKTKFKEGCLSYPDHYIEKDRYTKVRVKYIDHKGNERIKTFKDLEAIVIQHELSHLDGVPFIDEENS